MDDNRYWRAAEPKPSYDVVIVGGGGHGLSTAYYLAKNHGITDVCVVEKGWLAGGNMARNTTIIRSNYLWDESAAIYEHSLKLWEGLEEDLGADLQFSQRGVLNLAHNLGDVRSSVRRVEANRLNGVDAEWLTPEEVQAFCPIVNVSPDVRYPVMGATLQRRGGVARHDKVAWAYARAASDLGVDIVEHAEVTAFVRGDGGAVEGVETTRGTIRANKVALAAAGHTSVLAAMVGLRLPLQSHPLQALVSALYEPVLSTVVMSNAVHVYVSQADKGELVMGAGIDALQRLRATGLVPRDRAPDGGRARVVPDLRARVGPADLGRHRRRLSGRVADRRPDADRRPLPQLRLGHRRLQGDPGLRLGLRRHRRDRLQRPGPSVRAGTVHLGRAHRRTRRRGGRALMRRDTVRRFALSLPEAEERETWETATFRVRNKIFLMFSEQERHAWIKSTHDEQRALITEDPTRSSRRPTSGRAGGSAS